MADEWPEFSIPDVGLVGESPEGGSGAPSGSTPAAPVTPLPAEGTQAPAEGPKPGDDLIPKYRLTETTARLTALEAMNQRLLAMLEQRQAAAAAAPSEVVADPEADRRKALLKQIKELSPEVAQAFKLGENADVILAMIEETKVRRDQDKAAWDGYAVKTLSSVHDTYAKALSGGKKTGKDLPEETRQALTDNFVAWIMKDPTGQRVERYNSHDDALHSEFITAWQRQFVEPWRRQSVAGQVTQARRVANLPVGGGTSSPLGTPPPKPNDSDDEDAIFHRAFHQSIAERDAS